MHDNGLRIYTDYDVCDDCAYFSEYSTLGEDSTLSADDAHRKLMAANIGHWWLEVTHDDNGECGPEYSYGVCDTCARSRMVAKGTVLYSVSVTK